MRIPIPTRVEPRYAALFIALLFMAQVIEGTNILFALLTAVYIVLWVAAFNISGGLAYPSGSYVFSNGMYCVGLGFTVKALVGQPAQRNMLAPLTTLGAYCLTMLLVLIVVFMVKSLRPREAILKPVQSLPELKQGAIMCMVVGYSITVILVAVGGATIDAGALIGALSQLGQGFPIMSILLATTYEIRHSNKKRSINWINSAGIAFYVFFGLVNFGKSSMLFAFVAWMLAAVMEGYSFSKVQVLGLLFGAFFFSYYLTPYSQYVRTQRGTSIAENIPIAIHYLSDLNGTRQIYLDSIEGIDINDEAHFFDQRMGFLDRAIIVAADDSLISYTAEGHIFGLSPTIANYANIVPRFIWKDKPSLNIGNVYAHELGGLAEDDFATGISFSATADAFHEASWLGILTVLPLNLFLCFMVFDSFAGSARKSALALLPVMNMFIMGGEAGLGGPVYASTIGLLGLLSIAWTVKVLAPFVFRTLLRRSAQQGNTQALRSPVQVQVPSTKPSL